MAPMKRSRPEESVEVLESASSALRGSYRKRPRLSTTLGIEEDDSDVSDIPIHDDDVGELTSTQLRRRGGNRENYERERDHISSDEDEDAAVERATQDIRRQKSRQMENQAADNGVIESVTCINFMCHTKLQIQLGPLINFIIGHNGSGKSAVLTALTLCLGGKATSTNRGQNLKSFIKEGQESATLIVKIKNQGEGAYRRDVYGDSIIVERHFSIQGSSGFKIKSAQGRLISTKRSELDEITDFYALQLENPVNVLTQDMARQFLNSSSEADKYKFFIKGVQLEQLDNDYTLLSDSLDGVDAHMVNFQEDLKALHKKYEEAVGRWQLSQKQTSLRERIQRLIRQMAWAQVEEQERNVQDLEAQVQQLQAKIDQRLENARSFEEALDLADRACEESKAVYQEANGNIDPLQEKLQSAKDAFKGNKAELMELQAQQRGVNGSLTRARTTIQRYLKEIDEERQRLEAADGGSHAMKLAEIEEAEVKLSEARNERDEHPRDYAELERKREDADKQATEARNELTKKNDDLNTAQRQLNGLKVNRPRPLEAYHPSFQDVVRAIEMENRFHQKPVGPIGEHVRLLKPEWSSVLETFFGGTLDSFAVVDKHDQNLLSSIIKRFNCRANVYIGKPGRIDTTPNQPDARFETILNVIEIDDDLARNQLVVNQSIEQVILIKDRRAALSAMFEGPQPRNAKMCLCFHDTKRGHGLRFAGGAGGGQKSDPIQPYSKRPRMKADVEKQIRLQDETVQALKQEYNNLEQKKRERDVAAKGCSQAIKQHQNRTGQLKLAFQRAEDEVQKLKDELEAAAPQDGKLDALKAQLESAEVERDHHQSQFDLSVEQRDKLNATGRELKDAMDAADSQVAQAARMVEKAQEKMNKMMEKRQTALRYKNEAMHKVEDAEAEKKRVEEIKEEMIVNVNDFIQQASAICDRVPVGRGETPTSLDKKLDIMNKQLQRFEREVGGDAGQISRAMNEVKESKERAEHHIGLLEDLQDTLKGSLKNRYDRWKKFRMQISFRARAGFMHLLKERAFSGRMIMDHRAKLLQLLVQPDNETARRSSSEGAGGRATRTLSGGEKSFSTICLLLALWDAMGSPIRCLDEFDVFMDSVNRDVSMRMMIHAARGSVGRQFILITPQAMGNVDVAGDVKVIRLSDPERGQTALNFGQS